MELINTAIFRKHNLQNQERRKIENGCMSVGADVWADARVCASVCMGVYGCVLVCDGVCMVCVCMGVCVERVWV